jgi:hypothetical protein
MAFRAEADNVKDAVELIERFYSFHDDYVAGIEIRFEDYKGLNGEGKSTGIRDARKTVILTVNTYPYGKNHEHFVKVEFKEVKSFEISSPPLSSGSGGPIWGIFSTAILPEGDDMKWEFDFICGDAEYGGANFSVVCSRIVLTSDLRVKMR